MNFPKRLLAFVLCLSMIAGAFVFSSSAAEVGTEENPQDANELYFSATKSYLLNTDLAEGDSDGYWYTYTATGAGFACVDATARDAQGKEIFNYQVTVECKGKTYEALGEIYTRPVTPFRLNRGDTLKIHMQAKSDANGNYPKIKIYCNITTVYGNSSDPVMIKSKDGFVANVQGNKSVYYQDGTNGGLYGGKGITVSADAALLAKTEIDLNGVTYTDLDGDGMIELMLPGDPTAQIAAHPAFTIYNNSATDISYTINVVASAAEGPKNHTSSHQVKHVLAVDGCHNTGLAEHWYCSSCDAYWSDSACKNLTNPIKLATPAVATPEYFAAKESTCSEKGNLEYWYCEICNGYFADKAYSKEVSLDSLLISTKDHDWKYVETIRESTIWEQGADLYECSECGEEKEELLPLLERWMKGDINNDGQLNSMDTNFFKRVLVGFSASVEAQDAADFNGDGQVNSVDSYLMKCEIAGK